MAVGQNLKGAYDLPDVFSGCVITDLVVVSNKRTLSLESRRRSAMFQSRRDQ